MVFFHLNTLVNTSIFLTKKNYNINLKLNKLKSTEFAFWLQGLFELTDTKTLDEKQVETIKNHLKLVFLYEIDPSYSDNKIVQQIFQNIHDGKEPLSGVNIIPSMTQNYAEGKNKTRC